MTFKEVLELVNKSENEHKNHVKGVRFEELIRRYFLTDKKYCNDVKESWLWKNFPYKDQLTSGRLTGIDIVVRTKDGEYWAIQCKNYSDKSSITRDHVSGFLDTADKYFHDNQNQKCKFITRYFIATNDKISPVAIESFENKDFQGRIIDIHELNKVPVDWQKLIKGKTGKDARTTKEFKPLDYQGEIIDNVINHFKTEDRGKLIMACGTGKTLTALWIAERQTNNNGFILFLVPSIALVRQTLDEWLEHSAVPLNYACVCSDKGVEGDNYEDETITKISELPYPVTTNKDQLITRLRRINHNVGLKVIFSTYQSLNVVIDAQKEFQTPFDLTICDEAHRTAATKYAEQLESHITDIHDDDKLKSLKRLYMTATPKVYKLNPKQKKRAEDNSVEIYSMENKTIFGEEIDRLGFGKAVDLKILSDYRVIIFEYNPKYYNPEIDIKTDLDTSDMAKIQACYMAINKVGIRKYLDDGSLLEDADEQIIQRIVAFCPPKKKSQKIKQCQVITDYWNHLTKSNFGADKDIRVDDLQVKMVAGDMKVKDRDENMQWLKGDMPRNQARIITNVRCLSEGVDVPSLDAIIYLSARSSEIDIVQSIGRVMRTAKGKKHGYIIIPVAVESYQTIDTELRNTNYKTVWSVLNALKSHDERFEATIKQFTERIKPKSLADRILAGHDQLTKQEEQMSLEGYDPKTYQDWFTPKLIRSIGDKTYWEDWATDIAVLVKSIHQKITSTVNTDEQKKIIFSRLQTDLKSIIPSANKDMVLSLISQHVVTRPVFNALFDNSYFAQENPLSQALERFLEDFNDADLLNMEHHPDLRRFYQDVKNRVAGIDDEGARIEGLKYSDSKQTILDELYQNFFQKGFKEDADKQGIVVTPPEISEFIIHSIEYILKTEFDTKLADKGVNIIDPFAGTGSFMTRLIDSGLLNDNLQYKYENDLWINEILLLPHYLATVSIENAYHKQAGSQSYSPFKNSVFADTFQLYELIKNPKQKLGRGYTDKINRQIERQNEAPFTVILGNPPYRLGQDSANDNAKNQTYEHMDKNIHEKYAQTSQSTSVRSVYDSYIRAFLWAGQRIKKQGVFGFVSNGGWLESSALDGFRKELPKDFNKIYVFNLKGQRKLKGEQAKREGDNIFKPHSTTPITITFCIKNNSNHPCQIFYHDIGDNLTKKDKLKIIKDFKDTSNIDWQVIAPNEYGDWIKQRKDYPTNFYNLLAQKNNYQSMFNWNTLGIATNRDNWVFDYSKGRVQNKVQIMLGNYHNLSINNKDESKISWSRKLQRFKIQGVQIGYNQSTVVAAYRPFTKKYLHYQNELIESPRQFSRIFNNKLRDNLVINMSKKIELGDFGVLIINKHADINSLFNTISIPRYYSDDKAQTGLIDNPIIDNISDFALRQAIAQYQGDITKDDIFYYIYGFLHSRDYREAFKDNLNKDVPKIPLVDKYEDFEAFSRAGRQLAELHLNYEDYSEMADVDLKQDEENYVVDKMRFGKDMDKAKDKSTIIYNNNIVIKNISEKAYKYKLNGRSAIEWIVEYYQVKTDNKSQITQDPNDWSKEVGNPRYILDLLLSIIYVSEQTIDIVNNLPKLDND